MAPRGTTPVTYELGRTYVSGKGVRFQVFEQPRRVRDRDGYWIGPALLPSGRVEVFMWGPDTRPLQHWAVRAFWWLVDALSPRRELPAAASFEAVTDASQLPPAADNGAQS
jgi:hypothetical protein